MRLPFLLLSALLLGCGPKVKTPALELAGCGQEIVDAFGEPAETVVALAAADGGPLWRPDVLAAADRVCEAFESEMTDDFFSVKCLTTVPIMEGRPGGARIRVMRDELPLDADGVARFRALVGQLEFARGDVLEPGGGDRVTFIHLPEASFEGVELRALFERLAGAEVSNLQMAIDRRLPEELPAYRRLAPQGPSASSLIGLFDAGEAGALKEPANLLALQRFQAAAEAQPRVAETFTIVDDLTMVRRGLRNGNPAEALIPPKRAEVAQLMLALSMNPMGSAFGPRIDGSERVGLIRISLAPSTAEQRDRSRRRLDALLQQSLPQGTRGLLCPEL
jgi:hypothetical protein